jgi:hypothetical protein
VSSELSFSQASFTFFLSVKGMYFSWTNDPPNGKIRGWNVTELKVALYSITSLASSRRENYQIDPVKRHIDKSAVSEFWKQLEAASPLLPIRTRLLILLFSGSSRISHG